ncbi:hypothetical protein ACRAWF_40315 [Streptomyces sp. L7]
MGASRRGRGLPPPAPLRPREPGAVLAGDGTAAAGRPPGRGPGDRRPRRRARPRGAHLLPGHAPAPRHRAGHARPPRPPHPRRTDQRPRPATDPRDARGDDPLRGGRPHGHRLPATSSRRSNSPAPTSWSWTAADSSRRARSPRSSAPETPSSSAWPPTSPTRWSTRSRPFRTWSRWHGRRAACCCGWSPTTVRPSTTVRPPMTTRCPPTNWPPATAWCRPSPRRAALWRRVPARRARRRAPPPPRRPASHSPSRPPPPRPMPPAPHSDAPVPPSLAEDPATPSTAPSSSSAHPTHGSPTAARLLVELVRLEVPVSSVGPHRRLEDAFLTLIGGSA